MIQDLALKYKQRESEGATEVLFCQMLSPAAIEISQPYLQEEQTVIHTLLNSDLCTAFEKSHFIVVGGAILPYLDLLLDHFKKYVIIDPFIQTDILINNSTIDKSKIILLNKYCDGNEDIFAQKEPKVIFFWFNVAYHISRFSQIIDQITKSGDLVLISGWANTLPARQLFKEYYSYINQPYKNFLSSSHFTKYLDRPKLLYDFEGRYNHTKIFLL